MNYWACVVWKKLIKLPDNIITCTLYFLVENVGSQSKLYLPESIIKMNFSDVHKTYYSGYNVTKSDEP